MTRTLALAAAALMLSVSSASAIGFLTQMSCASDYYAYCSQFQVGSKELRICMRRAGPKLSKSCLNALIADGEVSKAEVERTRQEILAAKNAGKQPPAKQKAEEPKQKRTEIAKADDAAPKAREEKKADKERATPHKAEKLTINEQTFAALKQRQPKFIEEASAEEMPPPRDADKRADTPTAKSTASRSDDTQEEPRAKSHKKKTSKKSKAETPASKKKAKLAEKQEKQRSAKRNKHLAKQ
jgi:adenylate kinase